MKKLILTLLTASLLFSFCACSYPIGNDAHSETLAKETSSAESVTTSGQSAPESRLNGVSLADFSIVCAKDANGYIQRAAKYLKDQIYARTEIALEIMSDDTAAGAHEIVVGESNRQISQALEANGARSEFSILAQSESVAMEGNAFLIAAAAYFFVETYVPCDDFDAEIPTEIRNHKPLTKKAENFVLLIGDGMGIYQTLLFNIMENTAAYGDGEDIFYGYYLPQTAQVKTNSLSGTTDSAAAGTALATGYKTVNGYIGQDKNHKSLTSLTELAASMGKSTAVMSTESSTGATLAAFSAHANDRELSDEIAADQAALQAQYGTIIQCNYDFYTKDGVASIQARISGMLNALDDNENGFFLMYEEAYIDKHCHKNDINNTMLAVIRFNAAIAVFMEYAFYHPETCVIITADHETGELLPDKNGSYSYNRTSHSSANVPLFAYGEGTKALAKGQIENTLIPKTIAALMGDANFGDV